MEIIRGLIKHSASNITGLQKIYFRKDNQMFKKLISVLLCAAISLPIFTASAAAEEAVSGTVSENEGIIEALHMIEPVKENYGLTEADLENMKVSAPVKTYEYTSEGLSFLRNYFPLICDGTLVAWAIENAEGDEVFYQISTSYINDVNAAINNTTSFALIYDQSSCYIVDGANMQKLGSYEKIGGRSVLTKEALETADIELSSVSKAYDLGYTNQASVYGAVVPGETTYKCDVLYINQDGYYTDNLCWAASIACIVSYIKKSYYNAWDVYTQTKSFAGLESDNSLPVGNEEQIYNWYGLSYQFKAYVPVFSNIETNIRNGYPLHAIFAYQDGFSVIGHAGVIHGCTNNNQNSNLNYIYVMDPQFGFTTARYYPGSYNTYKYTSDYSGVELQLYGVLTRY